MDNKKRINQIWEDNQKIPFMQSKDILTFGYTIGFEDANKQKLPKENKSNQVVENSKEFIGTSKDLIEYTNNKKSKSNDPEIKKQKLVAELNVLNTKVKITGNILNYINANQDFWTIVDYIKNINREYQDDLYSFKLNNGFK